MRVKFLARGFTVAVGAAVGVIRREHACEHAGREHGRRKARAFLVG